MTLVIHSSQKRSLRVHLYSGAGQAFTLVEILVVISIIAVMMSLLGPALLSMKGTGDIAKAAYTVAGTLESARSYAMANNTYVWVGFYEEDASKASPAPAGLGRIVLSTVASKDGMMIYDPDKPAYIAPTRLLQVGKLVKIDNTHLKTAGSGDFPIGSGGGGDTFDARPAVSGTAAQIGDTSPPDSPAPFQYPVGNAATAQYIFTKVIQFSPRGEVRVNTSPLSPVLEVGLQPAHGTAVDTANKDLAAVQISGIAGNVKIFRR